MSDWLRVRAGRWASLDCGLSCPRQNGKNAILEVYELFVTVGLGRRVLHTAHEVKTGRKHFRRLRYFFGERAADPGAEFQELNKLVREIRNVNGQEGIYLTNGGSIELVARSKSSGRGFTVDTLVCDEAQELTDDELQAINPSISAAPSGDPLGDIAHILGELLKDPIGYPNARLGIRLPLGAQRNEMGHGDPEHCAQGPQVFQGPCALAPPLPAHRALRLVDCHAQARLVEPLPRRLGAHVGGDCLH